MRSEDLNKHRNDVFRLLGSLPEESRFDLPEPIRRRTAEFAALFTADSEEWDAIRAAVGALALEPQIYAERRSGLRFPSKTRLRLQPAMP